MTHEASTRRRFVSIGIVVLVALVAGVGGWLLGRSSGDGERVHSLAEAIALANAGDLPSGGSTDREPRSATTTATASTGTAPTGTPPIIVHAVVTGTRTESGHDVVVLSTRGGDVTLRADQIAEVAGLQQATNGGGAALPVGAHVLLFQSTFGPAAKTANDYRVAVLPPGFGG